MARSQCWTTVSTRTGSLSAPDVNSTDNNQPWKKPAVGFQPRSILTSRDLRFQMTPASCREVFQLWRKPRSSLDVGSQFENTGWVRDGQVSIAIFWPMVMHVLDVHGCVVGKWLEQLVKMSGKVLHEYHGSWWVRLTFCIYLCWLQLESHLFLILIKCNERFRCCTRTTFKVLIRWKTGLFE